MCKSKQLNMYMIVVVNWGPRADQTDSSAYLERCGSESARDSLARRGLWREKLLKVSLNEASLFGIY